MEETANDGAVLVDATGSFPGVVIGAGPDRIGVDGCGSAFVGNSQRYAEIPNAPEWALIRSIDMWLYLPPPSANGTGIISRDASGVADPGHFSVFHGAEGTLAFRLQPDGNNYLTCRPNAPVGQWIHVGINIGPPNQELWVDGVEYDSGGTLSLSSTYACGADTTGTLAGNTNPWVVGASSASSSEGAAGADRFFVDGRIDELRFSTERRDFSACAD